MDGINDMDRDMAANKRQDPDYMQVSGFVKKDVGLRFKAACALQGFSLSGGLEQALISWLQDVEKKQK